ncbi:MAG: MBOAT family protein [Paludibacteraceae bacterium]|nr:MBOAT family protein [Paludibacteraceae bacterium]
MLFNSFEFLLFFPIVCIIYYLIPSNRWRNLFLLAASYYFYMCWKPVYALLLLSSTAITFAASILMDRYRNRAKLFLVLSLVTNLAILFFFKYYNFAADNIRALMSMAGIAINIPEFKVLLPVGISFYIFQALGYSIDVYRKDVQTEKNFFTYALFVSFFPQLVAGPIERSTNLLQQFHEKKIFDGRRAIEGTTLMLWGYFLKLVIADRCAISVDYVYNNMDGQTALPCLIASCLFCFQLYGDFAGYSFIATGCAKIMGFSLMDNFRRPYFFSVSVQDFWRRNHISLTTWFMDYIYYPMVGTSSNIYWWCFCMFFTFFVSGFWHGAAWTYVLSFTIFGIYLVICVLKDKRQRQFEKRHNLKKKEWWLWLNRAVTFFLVMIALVFFRANSSHDGFSCLSSIFSSTYFAHFDGGLNIVRSFFVILLLFIVEFAIEYKKIKVNEQNHFKLYTIASALLFASIIVFGVFDGGQFIYFQF